MKNFRIISDAEQNRDITGYRPRKAYTYDYDQNKNDELLGSNGCVIFRAAEAYLNYMEACYEKTVRSTAKRRDIGKPSAAVQVLTKITQKPLVRRIWAVKMIWLLFRGPDGGCHAYNIRRERRCEFNGEGMLGRSDPVACVGSIAYEALYY